MKKNVGISTDFIHIIVQNIVWMCIVVECNGYIVIESRDHNEFPIVKLGEKKKKNIVRRKLMK